MTSTYDLLNSLVAMPYPDVLKQPESSWLAVQALCLDGWLFAVRRFTGIPSPEPLPDRWLTEALIEPLEAWDVPVRRMFTLVCLRNRATKEHAE